MGTITAPTLIIWGDRDHLLPGEDQRELTDAIPGSRLVVYQETGHLVLWEQPDRVATDLIAFVEGSSQQWLADRLRRTTGFSAARVGPCRRQGRS